MTFLPHDLFNYTMCAWLSGFQGPGDCNTSNYWYSPEDERIWCREQGYLNTQGHWSKITLFQNSFAIPNSLFSKP